MSEAVDGVRAPSAEIVVLNYNGRTLLDVAFTSIFGQTYADYGVILLDNGSTDGSVEFVREKWPETRVVALAENVGVTGALNHAVEATSARYIALLNNDIELEPDWLAELVTALTEHPGAGSAAGKLLSFSRREVIDGAGDVVSWSGACYRRGQGETDRGQYNRPEAVFSASGAAALYRREAFERVGLFDEDFYAYLEDVDWGFRAQLAGFSCRYVPSAVAFHVGGATTGGDERVYLAHLRRNVMLLVLKNYPAKSLLRHAHKVAAYQMMHVLVAARDGQIRDHARALRDVVRLLPSTLRKRRTIQRGRQIQPSSLETMLEDSWGFEVTAAGGRRFVSAGVRVVLSPLRLAGRALRRGG